MPKSTARKAGKAVAELPFEEAMAELEAIVESLESEANTLEESMRLYERGQALAARCSELLESAQIRVRRLGGDPEDPSEVESR